MALSSCLQVYVN